jgi:hypothetical protein
VADNWELKVGIRKEFWGVSESQHLVDIINQTDLVENSDTEDKLGQPMINLSLVNDWGILDLYLLTGFRERTFAGNEGRLRSIPEIDVGEERYEKHGIEKHMAYAIRWSHSIGDWDLGFSHFYGTSRDPSILVETDEQGVTRLIPYYEMIHQTAADIQITKNNWLWKLESIVRSGQGKAYFAGTGGFEYTFYSVFEAHQVRKSNLIQIEHDHQDRFGALLESSEDLYNVIEAKEVDLASIFKKDKDHYDRLAEFLQVA